jgi:hypothetical protein
LIGDFMKTKSKLAWVLWGGLALGLLAVLGCQEGAGTVVGPDVVEPTADAGRVGPESTDSDGAMGPPVAVPGPDAAAAIAGAQELEDEADVTAEAGPPVALELRFEPGRTAVYRVTTETQKSVEWEGEPSIKPEAFKGGRTGSRVEITFEQRTERLDDDGDAIVAIEITALKYVGRVRSNVVLEFDSGREQDRASPLAALIGAGYKVEMSSKGAVLAVIDAETAREAVRGDAPVHQTAQKLLTRDAIRRRHALPPLEVLEDPTVRPGQRWSNNKAFSFGMMGGKTFERIYTLQSVESEGDERVAVVEMQGIPSAAMAQEMHRQQVTNMLAQMFDNTNSYAGRLELDLRAGRVEQYAETLRSEWVAVDPAALTGDAAPAALRMGERRSHRLERIE